MHVEIKGMSPLLSVFDMPTSLAFYRDVLGFKVIHDSGKGDNSGWVMLQGDDVTFILNTAYLKTKGIGLEPPVNAYYGMRQLYFHDPDGYSLCFQWPIDSAR